MKHQHECSGCARSYLCLCDAPEETMLCAPCAVEREMVTHCCECGASENEVILTRERDRPWWKCLDESACKERGKTRLSRCVACDVALRWSPCPEKTREYKRGVHLPFPRDLDVLNCPKCGEVFLSESEAAEVDRRLAAALEAAEGAR